jgi:hypothetical protein
MEEKGKDSLEYKFYSFKTVKFGREKLMMKAGVFAESESGAEDHAPQKDAELNSELDIQWNRKFADATDTGVIFFDNHRHLQ